MESVTSKACANLSPLKGKAHKHSNCFLLIPIRKSQSYNKKSQKRISTESIQIIERSLRIIEPHPSDYMPYISLSKP